MSSEAESEIEKRLRAFAKQRREQAGQPLELHPATRRLLQGEVARQFGKQGREGRSFWDNLRRYWPRFAFGIAALALVAIVAVSLWLPARNKDSMTLARNDISAVKPLEELRPAPSAAPAPTSAETVSRDDALKLNDQVRAQYKEGALGLEAGKAETANRRMLLSKNAAGEPVADQPAASLDSLKEKQPADSAGALGGAVASSKSEAIGQRFGLAGNSARSVNAPVAPPASSTSAGTVVANAAKPGAEHELPKAQPEEIVSAQRGYKSVERAPLSTPAPANREVDTASGTLALVSPKNKDMSESSLLRSRQAAAQTGAAKLRYEPPAPKSILASFQLQRTGESVRIVDADGSVYSGTVQATFSPTPVLASGDKKLLADREAGLERKTTNALTGSQMLQSYFFRAIGTNLSLNEKVVFTGNVVTSANETSFKQTTNAPSGAVSESPTLPAEPSPLTLSPQLNSRVSGRAQIGEGKEIEINAVPSTP